MCVHIVVNPTQHLNTQQQQQQCHGNVPGSYTALAATSLADTALAATALAATALAATALASTALAAQHS